MNLLFTYFLLCGLAFGLVSAFYLGFKTMKLI